MPITLAQIREHAPYLRLHRTETHFPMDPAEFIRRSRFRHHKSLARDQGYNKRRKKWITTNSKHRDYYDIPVAFIDRYRKHGGKNRRPRDPSSGSKWNVFLEPNGRPVGSRKPSGVVPVFYYAESVDTGQLPAVARRLLGLRKEKYDKIMYWWFFGFNPGPAPGGIDDHQGDWEHVTLKLQNGRLKGAWFAAHTGAKWVAAADMEAKTGRPVVYCARGSHASYPRAGTFPLMFGVRDRTSRGGVEWDTAQCLLNLRTQPWRRYAGAWGGVGQFAHTTGPLGPWHKVGKFVV